VGREIQRRALACLAGDENMPFAVGVNGPHDGTLRTQTPVFRTAILLQHPKTAATPRWISGDAQATPDDAVHFFAQHELSECELRFPPKGGNCLVPDLEQGVSRERILVLFDLPFDVELVLVSE
jgi:hypothetical protein